MSNKTTDTDQSSQPKLGDKRDKYIKLGFIIVLIAGVIGIYLHQRNPTAGLGWSDDYDAVLAQGRARNKPVILLFKSTSPNEDTKKLISKIQSKSSIQSALKKHDYLTAIVLVDEKLTNPAAKEHEIRQLPTVIVFSSAGAEVTRKEGYIGDAVMVEILSKGVKD